ncbi:MAG: OmpA family protein [Alphaproteobacteria bacterium]|nr:OmpA family protein [Alphaproteobacteria bacterium]
MPNPNGRLHLGFILVWGMGGGAYASGIAVAEQLGGTSKAKLSEEDPKKQIEELSQNAQNMRAKEQSIENKTLGAASMATTGIGAMNLMSGMAEQNADDDAERAMKAYLETFRCNYGGGSNFKGGEVNIELPGGNDLAALRREYMALAADLKQRKEQLGIAPGIESEVILDQAATGLYDDVGTGITGGAYTSVARALMNPAGDDAAAWNAQKADAASKTKTGLITAAAGVAIGVVGDIALNRNNTDQSAQLVAKYNAMRQQIREDLTELETGSHQDAITNPADEPFKEPVAADPDPQRRPVAPLIDGTPQLVKIPGNLTIPTQLPSVQVPAVYKPVLTLFDKSLFDSGKYTVRQPADQLDKAIDALKKAGADNPDFKILLIAHTDRDAIIQTAPLCRQEKICTNEQLSQARADAVGTYIRAKWTGLDPNRILLRGVGAKCAVGTTTAEKTLDRRVAFYVIFGDEDANQIPDCTENNGSGK